MFILSIMSHPIFFEKFYFKWDIPHLYIWRKYISQCYSCLGYPFHIYFEKLYFSVISLPGIFLPYFVSPLSLQLHVDTDISPPALKPCCPNLSQNAMCSNAFALYVPFENRQPSELFYPQHLYYIALACPNLRYGPLKNTFFTEQQCF